MHGNFTKIWDSVRHAARWLRSMPPWATERTEVWSFSGERVAGDKLWEREGGDYGRVYFVMQMTVSQVTKLSLGVVLSGTVLWLMELSFTKGEIRILSSWGGGKELFLCLLVSHHFNSKWHLLNPFSPNPTWLVSLSGEKDTHQGKVPWRHRKNMNHLWAHKRGLTRRQMPWCWASSLQKCGKTGGCGLSCSVCGILLPQC